MFLQSEGVVGEREGRKKKDLFQKSLCHLPPPPRTRTNRGQSGWESKQKSVSLAPGGRQSDPRAPETELEDKALRGVGEGNELCRFQSLPPHPALSPGTSVSDHCRPAAGVRLPGEMTRVFMS